jgi:hypothetical protein
MIRPFRKDDALLALCVKAAKEASNHVGKQEEEPKRVHPFKVIADREEDA